jgi:signal transduction histidine kinase
LTPRPNPTSTLVRALWPGPAGYVEGVFRAITGRWDLMATTDPAEVPLVLKIFRALVLVVVMITVVLFAIPRPHDGPRAIGVLVSLFVSCAAWAGWLIYDRRPRVVPAALSVLAVSGGVLAGLTPLSPAVAVGCVATSAAGSRLDVEQSLAIAAATVATFLAAGLTVATAPEILLGYPITFVGMWALGLTRRSFLLRAEQAEKMLAETRRARAAETEAAALGERARIAREIHDVLAHSLAAVSVNLQAAEGLLAALPEGPPALAKAIECIDRAGAFTREGMADARRAILALRGNAAPLPEQLAMLAEQYRADGDPVGFSMTGAPRPVGAEAGLAAYRAAQEALTNARKHAPGQPVSVSLAFGAGEVQVLVTNPLAAPAGEAGEAGELSRSGAGYGLTGLRERAALGGGTLEAGPADGFWRVCLRIPA